MKRFIIALILLTLILVFCGFAIYDIKNTVAKSTEALDQIEQALIDNNLDQASEQLIAFMEYWEKKGKVLSLYLNEHAIEEITLALEGMPPFIASKDMGELMSLLAQTKSQIAHMYKYERPSVYNIV